MEGSYRSCPFAGHAQVNKPVVGEYLGVAGSQIGGTKAINCIVYDNQYLKLSPITNGSQLNDSSFSSLIL